MSTFLPSSSLAALLRETQCDLSDVDAVAAALRNDLAAAAGGITSGFGPHLDDLVCDASTLRSTAAWLIAIANGLDEVSVHRGEKPALPMARTHEHDALHALAVAVLDEWDGTDPFIPDIDAVRALHAHLFDAPEADAPPAPAPGASDYDCVIPQPGHPSGMRLLFHGTVPLEAIFERVANRLTIDGNAWDRSVHIGNGWHAVPMVPRCTHDGCLGPAMRTPIRSDYCLDHEDGDLVLGEALDTAE